MKKVSTPANLRKYNFASSRINTGNRKALEPRQRQAFTDKSKIPSGQSQSLKLVTYTFSVCIPMKRAARSKGAEYCFRFM
jgi:hypothetical protein